MVSESTKEIFRTYCDFKLRILLSQLGSHFAFALPFNDKGGGWTIGWRRFLNDRPKRSTDRKGWSFSLSGWRGS